MLGTIDWGGVWDWIVQPEVIIPVGIALIGGAYKVGTRRRDRRDRATQKLEAREAERQRSEDALDATHVDFGRWAAVPFGTGAGRPSSAPLTIEVYEATVWIHSVRLRWRWTRGPEDAWQLEGGACEPYEPGVKFPIAVPMGETIELTWAGGPLPRQEAIEWGLDIEWGLSRDGATRVKRVGQSNTSWQEVPAGD